MKRPQKRAKRKKKSVLASADSVDRIELQRMAEKARYRPSPYHKADSSATGKGAPRPDKTVCGSSELVGCRDAVGLLKAGILRGMTSSQVRNGWPQNVWAVDGEGIVYEAQLGNSELGEYHGYPMKADDHFSRFVRREWEER